MTGLERTRTAARIGARRIKQEWARDSEHGVGKAAAVTAGRGSDRQAALGE